MPSPSTPDSPRPSPPGSASRALELALHPIPSLDPPSLAELVAALPPSPDLAAVALVLAARPELTARTGEWDARDILARTGTGSAFILEHADGWLVVTPAGTRATVTQCGAHSETPQVATLARLTELCGGRAHGVLIESRFGLSALRGPDGAHVSPWRRLRSFIALERTDVVALAVFGVVVGGLSLAVPIAVQVLVNTIALGSLLQPLVVLSVLLLGVLALSGVTQTLQAYTVEMLQRRTLVRVAEDFARRIPSIRFEAHDTMFAPELVNRFFEVVGLQRALSRYRARRTALGAHRPGSVEPAILVAGRADPG